MEFLSFLEEQRRGDINLRSLTNARGWAGIFNAFKDKDSDPVQPLELIPFPDDFELGKRTISHETERILERLIQDKKLSMKAVSLVVRDNPKLKEALSPG